MRTAITRAVGQDFGECVVTFIARAPMDVARAACQHESYEQALRRLGVQVVSLPTLPGYPDAMFVEDVAVVLPELAVVARPGSPSRQGEVASVAAELGRWRPPAVLQPPATLDGGDVLCASRVVYVGVSTRTNADAVRQLQGMLRPHGYEVRPVPVAGCLHLKTACTQIADDTLLINPAWVDAGHFRGFDLLTVDAAEQFAANALRVGSTLLYSASFPRTRDRLQARGYTVEAVDISELEKAEAGVTCLSILFDAPG